MNKPSQILVGLSVLLFLLSRGSPAFSQTVTPQVVASCGADTYIGSTQLSYTVGEPVIQTLSIGTNYITQGFQQPDYGVIVGVADIQLPSDIRVFPNPTTDQVTVQVGNQEFTAEVYSTSGQIVVQAQKCSGSTQISLRDLPSATYFLVLTGTKRYSISLIKVH